jgi:hypothetical protein
MTDNEKPTGWFAPPDRPPAPPPLPPPPPAGELPLYGEPPPPSPPPAKSGRVAALALAGLAVLAAGVFGFSWLTAGDGASSPEAAVDRLFGAIANEDPIGALEALAPGERKVLRQPFEDIVGELQRLGILDEFDLRQVPGTSFSVEDLRYETTALTDEVVVVEIVDGTLVTRFAPDEFPIGPVVRDQVVDDDESGSLGEPESTVVAFADDPIELVAVQEDGGWHVSLAYTIAEAIRGDSDTPLSALGTGPDPVGGSGPEEVVRDLVGAAVDFDATRALTLLPSDEMRALYDYAPLFLPGANEAAAEARDEGTSLTVSDLQLSVDGDGSVRRVRFEAYDIEMVDEHSTSRVTYDGECTTGTTTYDYSRSGGFYDDYGPDIEPTVQTDEFRYCRGDRLDDDTYLGGLLDLGFFSSMSEVEPGLTVVELDGRWYVSPVRSILDSVVELLEAMSPEDVTELTDFFGTSGSARFEEVGSAIESDPYDPGGSFQPIDPLTTTQYAALEACYSVFDELDYDAPEQAWEQADAEVEACQRAALGDRYDEYFGLVDRFDDSGDPANTATTATTGTVPVGPSNQDEPSIGGPPVETTQTTAGSTG